MKNFQRNDFTRDRLGWFVTEPQNLWKKACFVVMALCYTGLQLALANNAYGQSLQDKKVVLNLTDASLVNISSEIDHQTSLLFAYDPTMVTPHRASISGNPVSVELAMRTILASTPLTYKLINDKILVTRASSNEVTIPE